MPVAVPAANRPVTLSIGKIMPATEPSLIDQTTSEVVPITVATKVVVASVYRVVEAGDKLMVIGVVVAVVVATISVVVAVVVAIGSVVVAVVVACGVSTGGGVTVGVPPAVPPPPLTVAGQSAHGPPQSMPVSP